MSFSVKEGVSYYSKLEDAVLNLWSTLNTDTVLSNILDIENENGINKHSFMNNSIFWKKNDRNQPIYRDEDGLSPRCWGGWGQSFILLILSREDEVSMMER